MKPLNGLFKPIPFLIKYPVFHQKYFPQEMYLLQLRPFSIMEDISTVYMWINRPTLLCSGHITAYQRNMLKYYKEILDSNDSQTFMILKDANAVCQIDVFQAASDELYRSFVKSSYDISVRYLADFRISSSLFKNSIKLLMEYLFSFSGNPVVFINLEPGGFITGEEFTAIGFKFLGIYPYGGKATRVYSCTRNELKE